MTLLQKEKIEISVKIMADVVESYLGALTLDQGLEAAERFLQVHLFPTLSVSPWCPCVNNLLITELQPPKLLSQISSWYMYLHLIGQEKVVSPLERSCCIYYFYYAMSFLERF